MEANWLQYCATKEQLEHFDEQGYLIVEDALSAERVEKLSAAADRVDAREREKQGLAPGAMMAKFRSVIEDRTPEMVRRGFDFSKDYRVINLLGQTYFDRARRLRTDNVAPQRKIFLQKAVETFQRTLGIDSENVTAHYNLQQLFRELGDNQKAEHHAGLHARYKPDDNARDRAVGAAKARYPAANAAAEEPVFYRLQRPGAPGLPAATTQREPRPTTQSGSDE